LSVRVSHRPWIAAAVEPGSAPSAAAATAVRATPTRSSAETVRDQEQDQGPVLTRTDKLRFLRVTAVGPVRPRRLEALVRDIETATQAKVGAQPPARPARWHGHLFRLQPSAEST